MVIKKLLLLWSVFLTLLSLVAQTEKGFFSILPGLAMVWLVYFVFCIGSKLNIPSSCPSFLIFNSKRKIFWFLILFCVLAFIVHYIRFYTGSGIENVFGFLSDSNRNNYREYQRFFQSNQLSKLTLTKIPYVFGLPIFKYLALYVLSCLIIKKSEIHILDIILIGGLSLFFVYSSMGRGTSFEIFELLMFFIYSIYLRAKTRRLKIIGFNIYLLLFLSITIVGALYFGFSLNKRFNNSLLEFDASRFCTTRDYCLNYNSLLFSYSKVVSISFFKLAGYFCHGLFFISTLLDSFLDQSLNMFSFMLPNGDQIIQNCSYREMVCGKIIDCGATWIPEIIDLISMLGFPITMLFIFLLGIGSKFIFSNKLTIPKVILGYYLFLFLISLCTGKFLTVSSSNKLIVASILFYLVCTKIVFKHDRF